MPANKKYDILLADPPWTFVTNRPTTSRVHEKYDIMTTKDLCTMPISLLLSDNCALFLWATWPTIEAAFKVIPAWGFTYRTVAWVWIKAKPRGLGFHFGQGTYTRANSEICLLGVKGKMPVVNHSIQALIYHPVMKHSQKPDDQYRKIEALYPNMRYLELFARHKHNGWDAWGNEVDSDIVLQLS